MRFSNLTPADKLKAAGLIGLIVVVLVFVTHTMLGIVAPAAKKAPKARTGAVAAVQSSILTPPPAAPIANQGGLLGTPPVAGLGLPPSAVHDPFVPLKKPAESTPHTAGAPLVRIRQTPLPSFDRVVSLPPNGPMAFDPAPAPEPAAAPDPVAEPKIQVLGYVAGDDTVVTLSVDGKVGNYKPGDAISTGYRMAGNDEAGARIRRHGTAVVVPVGEWLNGAPEAARGPDAGT